jgi:hypothetical protein
MAQAISTRKNSKLIYIIGIWLLAGTLDGLSAILLNWKIPAATIFKYIASGYFGKTVAYAGGTEMVIWGVCFHYLNALLFTTFFFLLHPMFYSWFRNWFVTAIFYGIIMWMVMNLIVVPFSNIYHNPAKHFDPVAALRDCVILIVCLGIPISYISTGYYFYKRK